MIWWFIIIFMILIVAAIASMVFVLGINAFGYGVYLIGRMLGYLEPKKEKWTIARKSVTSCLF